MAATEHDRQLRERSALTAVLLGQTGVPRGPVPNAAEMRAWAAKRLSGTRLAEVESHIAHDPQVFARAMNALREQAQTTAGARWIARIRHTLAGWVARPLPAFATGLAALAVVAIVVSQLHGSLEGAAGGGVAHAPVLRGGTESPADWRLVAFRGGYSEAEAAVAADRAEARAAPQGCVDGDGCAEQVRQLVRFGKLLAQLNALCEGGSLDPSRRAALAGELQEIEASMADSLELLPWRGYARALAADLAPGATGACARADALRMQLIAH
jgi:hypothetical protein